MANNITLGDNSPLDYNLKPIKVGGKTSPLEMSASYPDDSVKAKVKVVGDLEVTGTTTGISVSVDDASLTEKGIVELATTAEVTSGSDTTRAITPRTLKDGYEGSGNIETVGDLDSGAITSGFGNIDTGSSTITTTGTITSGNGVSGRFNCSSNYFIANRMGSVNTWYLANQNLGTSITAGDWATHKFNYAAFTATSDVKLKKWYFVGELSSAVDWEFELWDLTIPSNGTAAASTAAKVGSTQSVSATAYAIYTIGQDDLDYTVSAGHQLYVLTRYTSGSGTKYTYGTMTMEFTNG